MFLPDDIGLTADRAVARRGRMWDGFLRFVTFGRSKSHAVTIGGWTPGIRCLVAGHQLSCGCLAGIYHTLSKDVAEIIDAPANECPYRHDGNLVLWRRGVGESDGSPMWEDPAP